MRTVVLGGSGLIGKKLIPLLQSAGHTVVAASTKTGVNVLTGEGLTEALQGADNVVEVLNPPTFDISEVRNFFTAASANILPAAKAGGVKHHIILSVVGLDRMATVDYMKSKMIQERAIEQSGLPYTIVRATQFHEFVEAVVNSYTSDGVCRAPSIQFQPIAANDVASELARVVDSKPRNGIVDIAGPERLPMHEFVRAFLKAKADPRPVNIDESAGYFGASVETDALVPVGAHGEAITAKTTFASWMASNGQ